LGINWLDRSSGSLAARSFIRRDARKEVRRDKKERREL
jgi:hypothetical protein